MTRDATIDDLPEIDALYRASFVATFGHLYTPENLAAFLAKFTPQAWAEEFATPGYAFRVVEDEQGICGYAKISGLTLPAQTSAPVTELRQLYLYDRAKGSGAAAALMDWAIASARERGSSELWLSVFTDNHRAKRFYARYGFEDQGPYHFMVGDHADEDRLMRLVL